jgi:hypothetical protein
MAPGQSHSGDHFSKHATLATASQLWPAALAAALLLLAGCGRPVNAHPTARLEGKVAVDGQPIVTGRIQFFPRGPGQPDDAEISAGHYLADRVPTGKVRVTFTAVKATGKMIHEPGHDFPELVSIIPEQYQSGAEVEIGGDNPNQDFNLVSKPSAIDGKGR